MFLSELTEAIYAAGYDFPTVQDARRFIIEQDPIVGDEIMNRPLSTAQADPVISDGLAIEVLNGLSIPLETMECP